MRVVVAAAGPLRRGGLVTLVEEAGHEVLASTEPDGIADTVTDFDPDVLLAQLAADEEPGEMRAVVEQAAGVPVVFLVSSRSTAEAAVAAHASALPDDVESETLHGALTAARLGLLTISAALAGRDEEAAGSGAANLQVETLTPREVEILGLMAQGLTNAAIAVRLGISHNTVKFHVASVLGKLGAASRAEAVALGMRAGIVLV